MNVRIVPRGQPARTDLYGAVVRVISDGSFLYMSQLLTPPNTRGGTKLPLRDVAEILIDDDPGGGW